MCLLDGGMSGITTFSHNAKPLRGGVGAKIAVGGRGQRMGGAEVYLCTDILTRRDILTCPGTLPREGGAEGWVRRRRCGRRGS